MKYTKVVGQVVTAVFTSPAVQCGALGLFGMRVRQCSLSPAKMSPAAAARHAQVNSTKVGARSLSFLVHHPVDGLQRSLMLRAANPEERDAWMGAINRCIKVGCGLLCCCAHVNAALFCLGLWVAVRTTMFA
jgi:hypothetical protein